MLSGTQARKSCHSCRLCWGNISDIFTVNQRGTECCCHHTARDDSCSDEFDVGETTKGRGNWQESKEDENESGRCPPYQYTWYIISFVYNSWTGLWLWNCQILFLVVFTTLCKYWLTIKIENSFAAALLTSSFFFSESLPNTRTRTGTETAPKARAQYKCPVCKHPKKGHKNVDCPRNRK